MWNWFKGLFGFARPKRAIFRFWDGQSDRLADPFQVFMFLKDHPEFKIDSDPLLAEQGHTAAIRRMINVTREVFQIGQLSQGGLTDMETLELMSQFVAYMETIKKK